MDFFEMVLYLGCFLFVNYFFIIFRFLLEFCILFKVIFLVKLKVLFEFCFKVR